MNDRITYDAEIDLTAPTGGVLSAIFVTVEIEPNDGACLIYGTKPDGNMGYLQVNGPEGGA